MSTGNRRARGTTGYHAGLAAEDAAVRDYERRGMPVLARRWRGRAGEIDLIARDGDTIVFVEVKTSRDFDRALSHLGPRQIARLCAAAEEYAGAHAAGTLTEMRFDVALVDGQGAVRVIENALA
ncbi:YraN family protein [Citreimonas sp.]|uniref:YraN family protein n=1 Tax=Citreimonas sp. TaxID=3036715 RepID=UPI0035C7E134